MDIETGGTLNTDTLGIGDGTHAGTVNVNGTGVLNVATIINLDAGTLNFNTAGATLATDVHVESGSTGEISFAGGVNSITGELDKDGAELRVGTSGTLNYDLAGGGTYQIVGASANSDMTFFGGGDAQSQYGQQLQREHVH